MIRIVRRAWTYCCIQYRCGELILFGVARRSALATNSDAKQDIGSSKGRPSWNPSPLPVMVAVGLALVSAEAELCHLV